MRRLFRYLVILGFLLVDLVVGQAGGASATPVTGQPGPGRAALVVQFADKTVATRCVSFSEPTITGADLLARSGLPAVLDYNAGLGGAVCSIKGQGCAFPAESCFCRCQGASCEYWAYYYWEDDAWRYSAVGASGRQVTDGALEAWSWGPGNWMSGAEPPQITFTDVCGSSVAAQPAAIGSAPGIAAASRLTFVQELVPGYVAYFLTAAALVFAGAVILRRKNRMPVPEEKRHRYEPR